ncbi:MAG: ABC transporter permease [Patescibacteria group bacterium]
MFYLIRQSFINSVISLLANKVRSFLTMLGIIIGVGAVIIIMSVGAGAQSLILSQIKTFGTNLVGVLPGETDDEGPPASAMGIVITTLTYEDAMALRDKKNAPHLIGVVAYSNGVGTASWGSQSYDTNLSGCTVDMIKVEGGEVESGRFFNEEEEKNLAKVVVLGSTVKNELFGSSDAVGQRIKIKKHTFEVIGIMKERGTVAFQDYDDKIFLPVRTMQKLMLGVNHINLLRAKVDYEDNTEEAMEEIKVTLRDRHDISDQSGADDDFTVRSAAQALDMIKTITNALRYFLAAMAALSLIVGGIGIMNIMLVSVTERTREIGLRKAVGASSFNIMSQFLVEAITLTLIGGIIGIIGGTILSLLISVIANLLGYDWEFSVSAISIILATGVSSLVGLVFGIYPASKASNLDPIVALQYE